MPPTTPQTGRRTGTPPRCTSRPAGRGPGWAGGPMPPARSGPRTPRSWRPRPPRTAGGWPGSGPPPRRRPDPRPHPPSGASTWLPSGPPWPSAPAAGWPPPRPPADPPAPPHGRSATVANTRMLVVRARRAGANAGSGHNSTVRPRPPKTTSPPLVRRPAGGTTSGPIASSAREQESWLGAVRTAVDQAHLRSDAVAGLNTLADSLASYADWHGPAVARPPWAVLMAGAGRSRSWVGRRLAWLREHGLLVIVEHGLANRPAAYLLTIPTASPRRQHGGWDVGQTGV